MSARLVSLLLIALLAILHGQLWLGRGSIPHVAELQHKINVQKTDNTQAQMVNDRLNSEVRDLKEGMEMVEEKARSELGMVRPNEIFVQVNRAPPPAAPAPAQ